MRSSFGVLVALAIVGCAQGHAVDGGQTSMDAGPPPMDARPAVDARPAIDAPPAIDSSPSVDAPTEDASVPDAAPDLDAGSDASVPPDAGCFGGLMRCAGVCVDTTTSAVHCGACGNACATGESCVGGLCTPPSITWTTRATTFDCSRAGVIGSRASFTCPPGGSASSLWGTGEYTHDSSICTAAVHAGRITRATGGAVTIELRPGRSSYVGSMRNGVTSSSYGTWSCSFAVVGPGCPPAAADECDDLCIDTTSDVAHCGACGLACPTGASCAASACSCPGAQIECAGACVDTSASEAHCGACGVACATGGVCTGGSCGCPSGQTECAGACVDTSASEMHCGGCGVACGSGEVCTAGSCGCGPGLTDCGGTCIATASDPMNCGGCGVTCAAGELCGLGVCGARAITWSTNATDHSCSTPGVIGSRFRYACPASGSAGSAWGTDVYTNDSSICTAAVHAGRITLATGGAVTIEMAPGAPSYTGSTRNGITTSSWGTWGCSYIFPP